MPKQTTFRQGWDEFRQTGLLWFVNSLLHMFGWAIVIEYDAEVTDKVIAVYPARVTFRGFDQETDDQGRARLAKYMRDYSNELFVEAEHPPIKDYY